MWAVSRAVPSHFARRFDLSIVGQANPDVVRPQNLIIEAALFQSGRPVVVVPYIQKTGLTLSRVLVCWDGGRQAARAIADALPFLHRAKAIEVVIVATEPLKSDALPDAGIARHLLAMISTLILSELSPRKPTWQTPFFPMRRMSLRISSSWADMAIRDCASSS
jgi:hypothetical protein